MMIQPVLSHLIIKKNMHRLTVIIIILCFYLQLFAQNNATKFKVIAFYTAKNDAAHISFVHEAHKWFSSLGKQYHFTYDSTNNWNNLNRAFLSKYQVVLF